MFQPYIDSQKLFSISSSPPSYDPLKSRFLLHSPKSHSQFLHPTPLWKNKNFFIKLPFKLNDDINQTKATHPGMTPTDLKLAQEECSQLLKQGLYIDDVLLFSKDNDSHQQLLSHFLEIVKTFGIMLSVLVFNRYTYNP